MSNIQLIIEEKAATIGSFLVGRLLPFRQKRMVGPFAFIDHMGPTALKEHENLDVAAHPHIGLSTLTYLFEGEVMHRDSLGNALEITPGDVNWMTAGKGVVHSERTPDRLKNSEKNLHGLQIWIALPKEFEDIEPSFSHIEANQLPTWEDNTIQLRLVAGEAFGKKSAVPVFSPLYFIEIKTEKGGVVNIGEHLYGESALYILEGGIKTEGQEYGPKQLMVANNSKLCSFELLPNSSVYIFGGEPFPEQRFIFWNFVSSEQEKIETAKQMWINQEFPPVPGENEFVPLPLTTLKLK